MKSDFKKLTLEDIFVSNQFKGKTLNQIQWLPDGSAFTYARIEAAAPEIWLHEVSTGQERKILDGTTLCQSGKPVAVSAYQTTGDPKLLLITGERHAIWRHSFSAPYYLYHMETQLLMPIAGGDPTLQNVTLSPDGTRVAYVKANNVFVSSLGDGSELQLTFDGSSQVLNGVFDWVYEEEFQRADAIHWSPDNQSLAFWWSDQSQVKTQLLLNELPYYPQATELKYPKVGECNSVVRIGVIDLPSRQTTWLDLADTTASYLPRLCWTHDPDFLAVTRLNRAQNHLELLLADRRTGAVEQIYAERHTTWIEINDDLRFLADGSRLWTSEKDGWRHLYWQATSGEERQLTQGAWEVDRINAVDEVEGRVYFTAAYDHPTQRGLFCVPLHGGPVTRLSSMGGWHTALFAPNAKCYLGFFSNRQTPPTISLFRADGVLIRLLETNEIQALSEFQMVYPEFGSFRTTDGIDLNYYLLKPASFDPGHRYPVVVFGYGGPGSQMVVDRWGTGAFYRQVQRSLWHQYLTESGFLVFCVDNRGTGGRGKAFKDTCYGDISRWTVFDQVEGARFLAGLPFVDAQRIGFWGWSGGGYLAALLLTRASEVFKVGVAVAPVSDFRNYDTIWTERYMGLLSDNLAGYRAADVLTGLQGLKGRLLLIHGTGDDNVHPGNTLQMVEGFIAADKQVDMMLYPNRNHQIDGGNTTRHLFRLIASYFQEHL